MSLTDSDTIDDIRRVFETEDVAFVIGSAVSLFPPSSVVNGQRVTEALADRLAEDVPEKELLRTFLSKAAFEVVMQNNDSESAIRNWLLKLFNSDEPRKPNSVHTALAKLLARRPANVVTTNYDRFIEKALAGEGVDVATIIDEDHAGQAKSAVRYLKIHGCTSDPESMVFRLEQERPLQGWKARTFRSLVEGRVIVLVGYSGKDFEICPALYQSRAKAILWNAMPDQVGVDRFPSENAGHLFAHIPRMLFVSGDMHLMFGVTPQRPAAVDQELLGDFVAEMTPAGMARWQASILDTIGAPRQTEVVLRRHWKALDAAFRFERLSGIAYRRGRYRSAIYHGIRLAAERAKNEGWPGFALRAGLDAAFKLRNRGNHRLAKVAFQAAAFGWSRSGYALRREYAMNMAWFEILDGFRYSRTFKHMQRRIGQMEFISLHQGFWGSYYLVRNAVEELRPKGNRASRNRPPAMPSQMGFQHIGSIPAQIDALKSGRIGNPSTWDQVEREIQLARDTELHPERWKCALAALESGRFSTAQDLSLMRDLAVGLWRCQYMTSFETKIAWRALSVFWRRHGRARSTGVGGG